MTRPPYPGWHLDPDPLNAVPSDNEEARPRRRFAGCLVVALLVVVAWRAW